MTAVETILDLAREHGVSGDVFKKMKARRKVPHKYRTSLIKLAASRGITLDEADFEWDAPPLQPEQATEAAA